MTSCLVRRLDIDVDSTTSTLVHFLTLMAPAGIAWGDVSTRERMIISSQEVFGKLMQGSSDQYSLKFDVLARVAELPDGTLDQDKLKAVIRLLRPDRDGESRKSAIYSRQFN